MNGSAILRLIATVVFAVGIFTNPVPMVPLGLALWCGSTLVP